MKPANIRLGRKGLPGTNALTHYENSLITVVKRFITLAPDSSSCLWFDPIDNGATPSLSSYNIGGTTKKVYKFYITVL